MTGALKIIEAMDDPALFEPWFRGPTWNPSCRPQMAVMRCRGAELPTESEQSFGINAFAGLKPRDTPEVLLCTQMVAVHEVAMAMLTGAKMEFRRSRNRDKHQMTTKTNTRPKPNTTVDERLSRTQKSKPDKTEKTSTEKAPGKTIKFEATAATHKAVRTPLLSHTTGRLMAVMRCRGAELPTESEQSFGINAFAGLKPRDTAEVLLCTQMVAVHEVAMAMLTGAKMATEIPSLQEQGLLAIRLLGIFERQFQALAKARRPQQVVEVRHEHRHIHAHSQPLPGAGVVTEIEGQPYGPKDPRTLAFAPSPALLSQDAPADTLPIASDTARPMPPARRCHRDRRT